MKATIRLMNGLHVAHPKRQRVVCVSAQGMTVADVLSAEGVPIGRVSFAALGSNLISLDHVLSDGDDVWVYPPIDGG